MSVKIFALARRKHDLSAEAFADHWRHPHGTLARQIDIVRSYIQHRPFHDPQAGEADSVFDGIAEIGFASVEEASQFSGHPIYVKDMVDDEAKFIDQDSLSFFCTEGPESFYPDLGVHKDKAGTLWQRQQHWRSVSLLQFYKSGHQEAWSSGAHGDDAGRVGAFRYDLMSASEAIHGSNPPFAGVRVFWWPTLGEFRKCYGNTAGFSGSEIAQSVFATAECIISNVPR